MYRPVPATLACLVGDELDADETRAVVQANQCQAAVRLRSIADAYCRCAPIAPPRRLPWSDVNFETGIVTARGSKSGETYHVPIKDELRDVLRGLKTGSRAPGCSRT